MSKPSYGGQAVIEGVMMMGPHGKAIAVRNEDGELIYKVDELHKPAEKYPILAKPVLRGIINFAYSMISGIKDLTWSAAQAGETEDDQLSNWAIAGAILSALVFTIIIFVIIPVFAATWLHPYVGDFGRSLIEGILRAGLFIGYVVAIGRMNDIRRVFAYHGAEHKTINAYEHGAELTPENVSHYSCIHTRCGTSFILMVMLLMIIIFTFVGQTTAILRIVIKILLLPLIAGLSYELFRLPLRFPNNPLVKALVAPGLAMQRLTTREPDLSQIEVAIAALQAVPGFERNGEPAPSCSTMQTDAPAFTEPPVDELSYHKDTAAATDEPEQEQTAIAVAANVEKVMQAEYEPHGATWREKAVDWAAVAGAAIGTAATALGHGAKKIAVATGSKLRDAEQKSRPWRKQTAEKLKNGAHKAAKKADQLAHDVADKAEHAAHDVAKKAEHAAHDVAKKTEHVTDMAEERTEQLKDEVEVTTDKLESISDELENMTDEIGRMADEAEQLKQRTKKSKQQPAPRNKNKKKK